MKPRSKIRKLETRLFWRVFLVLEGEVDGAGEGVLERLRPYGCNIPRGKVTAE